MRRKNRGFANLKFLISSVCLTLRMTRQKGAKNKRNSKNQFQKALKYSLAKKRATSGFVYNKSTKKQKHKGSRYLLEHSNQ